MTCKTKEEAEKKARILKAKMKGSGWKIRVWRNFGWNYSVRNKYASVYEYGSKYHCMLSPVPDGTGGTPTEWYTEKQHKDPNKAVAAAVQKLQRVRDEAVAVMDTVLAVFAKK